MCACLNFNITFQMMINFRPHTVYSSKAMLRVLMSYGRVPSLNALLGCYSLDYKQADLFNSIYIRGNLKNCEFKKGE